MTMIQERVDEFFAAARERHAIYLRRQAGRPWPWTEDPLFRELKFTNVFRELDRTTVWFRNNARDELRDKPEVLLATVLFRWFNRTTTGEAIFCQKALPLTTWDDVNCTPWERFLANGSVHQLRDEIIAHCGTGPYVTGAYIIRGKLGMSKLDGVLAAVGDFYEGRWSFDGSAHPEVQWGWREVAEWCMENPDIACLEDVWRWLTQVPFLGPFMAYEIVTDLRWTNLLSSAPDIYTWANPGPGAMRGLMRLHGMDRSNFSKLPREQMLEEMRDLLLLSRSEKYWPQLVKTRGKSRYILTCDDGRELFNDHAAEPKWPVWELHEVEMWLCEADKYWRVKNGEGKTKGVYRRS